MKTPAVKGGVRHVDPMVKNERFRTPPAIWLRSRGGFGRRQYVEVLIEAKPGVWVSLIREGVADVGGVISHVIEPAGIRARLRGAP